MWPPLWLCGSKEWWAYFDDRQNHLRDVVGNPVNLSRRPVWVKDELGIVVGGAEPPLRPADS